MSHLFYVQKSIEIYKMKKFINSKVRNMKENERNPPLEVFEFLIYLIYILNFCIISVSFCESSAWLCDDFATSEIAKVISLILPNISSVPLADSCDTADTC